MLFAIAKFAFEGDNLQGHERKDLHSLVEKVRSRFKVCVKPSDEFRKNGAPELVVAALGRSETDLNRLLDDIASLCEDSGLGRIAAETAFIDDIDTYGES